MADKKQSKQPKAQSRTSSQPFAKTEQWLSGISVPLMYWTIGIGVLFAMLIFNARILETDNGLYIESGYYYAQNFFGYYFTSSAALYVMFLALPIAIFGINVLLLKSLSILFYAAGLYFLYRSFRGKVPNVVFVPAFIITALNTTILSYASLTFTESFYMMLQSLFFFVFLNQLGKESVETEQPRKNIKGWLSVGLALILLSLTKNIAVAAVGAVVLYFLFYRKYKNAVVVVGSYALFWGITELLKRMLWGDLAGSQYGGQSKMILLKNPYDPNSGQETISGFVDRFFGNAQIFLSSRFMEILGLRGENSQPDLVVTIIIAAAILFGVVRMIKNKERSLLVMALYAVVVSLATFIALHTSWGQTRYIMIFTPFFLIIILYGVYDLMRTSDTPLLRMIFVVLVAGLLGLNIITTMNAASTNLPTLQKNLSGDAFAGYPDEWANYLRLSQWCADSLESQSLVACRKPSVSFIYGRGKMFQGIYNVPSPDPDTLLQQLQRPGTTHIILDNIAGTVYRYMTTVEKKYPGTFVPVRQFGYNQSAAYLFKINYPY
ncbi:MAG: hypothetical protein HYV29_14760 [Ignavibacteriales bacterium]|nr:hypothetical protein [Ignavibacteriales bacterium]